MEFYYTPQNFVNEKSGRLVIQGEEFFHLTKSLRKKVDEEIEVTDGMKNVYRCLIDIVSQNKIECEIIEKLICDTEPELKLNLYLCLLKNPNRFEFAIEKCVELGIHSITPVISSRCISKKEPGESKTDRFRMIIKSAMCQSQRCYLPELKITLELEKITEQLKPESNNIVMYEFEQPDKIFPVLKSNEVNLLIGPEGGFSDEEINYLINHNWQSVSLGKRKFRAETAAIASTFKILN